MAINLKNSRLSQYELPCLYISVFSTILLTACGSHSLRSFCHLQLPNSYHPSRSAYLSSPVIHSWSNRQHQLFLKYLEFLLWISAIISWKKLSSLSLLNCRLTFEARIESSSFLLNGQSMVFAVIKYVQASIPSPPFASSLTLDKLISHSET